MSWTHAGGEGENICNDGRRHSLGIILECVCDMCCPLTVPSLSPSPQCPLAALAKTSSPCTIEMYGTVYHLHYIGVTNALLWVYTLFLMLSFGLVDIHVLLSRVVILRADSVSIPPFLLLEKFCVKEG